MLSSHKTILFSTTKTPTTTPPPPVTPPSNYPLPEPPPPDVISIGRHHYRASPPPDITSLKVFFKCRRCLYGKSFCHHRTLLLRCAHIIVNIYTIGDT
uniref:Uncharacterized protein n=1 Tax=Tanacetum cinerariifolium TaxID=118510 RepID=A0A6L2NK55_TANCI|nr:hypothetical protein [Tanacetum cinerariifolium]